ncbi:MAG: ATP-dependent DNA helicase [Lachnospiraceae bacterium]|nr:ATP-dependent DNA helicase [Lachnospiraceae bacterium]
MTAMEKPVISISVRNLVEFVLRSGDISEGAGGTNQVEAMQAGSRIHRKIQSHMGPSYSPEVPILIRIEYDDYTLTVDGRADGIDGQMVDEIKGVYRDVLNMEKPDDIHLAQAKCYAHMLCQSEGYDDASVQMTYVNLDTEEVKRFISEYTRDELADWFDGVILLYKRWADFSFYHQKERNGSIKKLEFPFEYRPGQYELCKNVYLTVKNDQLLFLEAPTGSGKTVSTLFPAVKAMGEGLLDRIFYLTSKTVTREVAKETLGIFREKGYEGKGVFLTAKDKICPFGTERQCDAEHCERAKGHFDRINDAVYELLIRDDLYDREDIAAFAKEKNVCPFELSLDIASWCDEIIGDVNYVFDPNAYLRRFFAEGSRKKYALLIDESHNLVDRGRKMYSADLIKEDILEVKRYFKDKAFGIPRALAKVNKVLLDYKKESEGFMIREEVDALILALLRAAAAFDVFFEKNINHPNMNEIRRLYFNIRDFLRVSEELGEDYKIYTEILKSGDFVVRLSCIDPSTQLQRRLDLVKSAVFFSATMQPVFYYKNLLCKKEKPFAMRARSIFSKEKRCITVARDVSSVYKRRGEEEYKNFARHIINTASTKTGNYLVFFPSYKMMEEISRWVCEFGGEDYIYIEQKSDMSEEEREGFLKCFEDSENDRERSMLAFAVAGGVFSEGIDLTGDKLIGVIIVGIPLPQVGKEREMIRDHFESKGMDGFSYAYLYPGMNHVMQAAGRLIRTVDDRGVIALLDERYLWPLYKGILPYDEDEINTVTVNDEKEVLTAFWDE